MVDQIPVPIANSELRHFKSSILGQEYFVKIRLPEDYSETSNPYPVLYLLDGDHAFAMASDIIQYLIYGQQIPDLIVISPAYGSKKTPPYGGTNMRDQDLLPFSIPGIDTPSGGVEYLRFFEQELVPYAEAAFRIDGTNRTLWGYSYGAIFVLYALFQKPDLFSRYIAVDGFDDHLFEIEAAYAAQHTSLPVKLALSAISNPSKFLGILNGRNYTEFKLVFSQLSALGHFAVGAEGLAKGLVEVFRL